MKVPLFDVTRQYHELRDEILHVVDEVLGSGRYIMGPNVEDFERQMSSYIGVKHAIGVANGSDALYIAVRSLGISEGDFVVTTAFSFFRDCKLYNQKRRNTHFRGHRSQDLQHRS